MKKQNSSSKSGLDCPELRKKIKKLEEHKHLFDIADQCGIQRDHIQFMNMALKSEFFRNNDFLWHLDDDQFECNDINKNTNTVAIQCNSSNWKHKCERLIKKKLNGK